MPNPKSPQSPGTCPECGAHIQSRHVLIAYETADQIERFAECPGCRTVVHPRRDHTPTTDPKRETHSPEQ